MTYQEQIELLVSRGMRIDNYGRARRFLTHLNYYRLAAYWLPFEQDHATHIFKSGTTFDQVTEHYIFDRELRLLVMDAIERFEVSLRAQWAYVMAHAYGPHAHLDAQYFKSKWSHQDRVTDLKKQERLIGLLKEKRQATISHAVTKGLNPAAPLKDSGIEWLGEVPEGWETTPMKYLVRLQSGGTSSKEQLDYWDGTLPWASAKDIKVEYLADTEDHITEFAVEQGAASLLDVGTVLVVVRGMILARTFPVTLTLERMAINQDLKAIIAGERLAAEFLAWYLRGTAEESLRRLDEAGHGTKALRMDKWTSLEIALPPLDEQSAIVAFLDSETAKIDTLVGEAQRAICLLKERRSALISAAVTGKIDVRGVVS